jgi:hypothetical protein
MSPVATLVERSTGFLTLVCLPAGHRTDRGGLLALREPENGLLAMRDTRTCREQGGEVGAAGKVVGGVR